VLISAEQLRRHHLEPDWVVVDCRFNLGRTEAGYESYRSGHIPGAHYAHLDRDLSGPKYPGSGRHPLPEPGRLVEALARWNICDRSTVVAYDDAGGAIAARLWWLLRWVGHEAARTALLDGGWQAWASAGYEVSREEPEQGTGALPAATGRMPTATTADVVRNLDERKRLLVDARAESRFAGREETIDRVAGHVPGAINVPFHGNLAPDGRFLAPTALRERYLTALGRHPAAEVICMCGSGVTACHNLFALDLAGLPGASLYAGSWSEWVAAPDRPVEPTPG
jgi:thiosulfate/3-mercaptopyruvate sulfurtransferase